MSNKSYNKEYYLNNKDKWRGYNTTDKAKLRQRKNNYRIRNVAQDILTKTRGQARVKNLEFNLELEDILVPTHCPYLKIPIVRKLGAGRQWDAPSIDRIDSTKGYIKGNIQIISDLANRMKSNATQEQLLQFAFSVIEMHRQNQIQDDDYD